MSGSPYLEAAAMAERERDEALDQLAGVEAQCDEMKRQLNIALEQNCDLRKECQRLHEELEHTKRKGAA